LNKEPEHQEEEGRYLDKLDEEEDGDKGDNPGFRKEDKICTHHTGNCTTCSNGGDMGTGLGNNVAHTSPNAAEQIEKEVTKMPQPVFHIVSKDPEIEHVSDNVKPPAVEKQGSKEREESGKGIKGLT